ncbi:membrane protein [Bacillus phage BC-VP]|nr:membrane protein [Bacillus phage BC-VP]
MNANKILIGCAVTIVLFLLFMFILMFIPWAFPLIIIGGIVFGTMAGWHYGGRNKDN